MARSVWTERNGVNRRHVISPDIARIAEGVARLAASNTPRLTGAMARGWTTTPGRDPGTTLVTNTVPYARFVEYGTRRMRAAAPLGRATAVQR